MILTGNEIINEIRRGNICVQPFSEHLINPNSLNYRLGSIILPYDKNEKMFSKPIYMCDQGYVLDPGVVYLGSTLELLGSNKYSMSLIGRSSIGRLGLFVQISANLGHVGSHHRWTLELVATRPIRIYPHMKIGQISFWRNRGDITKYLGGYSRYNTPKASNIYADREFKRYL